MMQQEDTRAAFNAAYAALNAAQKKAVDSIEGPVMVIAGPGTGKTQILTLRIANILLQTDTQPEQILGLTFTESGVRAMRERLIRYVGVAAYRVPLYTFHGFAQHLISTHPEAFPRIIGGRPASDLQKVTCIEDILQDPSLKLLRPMGRTDYYVSPVLRMIGTLKQEYISPAELSRIIDQQMAELEGVERIHQKGAHKGKVRSEYTKKETIIAKNRELSTVYQHYEALLRTEQLYDFEDMIAEAVRTLSADEDFLREIQETYQYVLADEHQDVNGAQNQILELLCSYHTSPNLFVVGDEKQAIYRFQGASLDNFLYFEDRFTGTQTIALTDNYRSGQAILDAAHSLVAVADGPLKDLRIPLTAATAQKAHVTRRDFTHQVVEDAWIVAQVQQYIDDGVPQEEIAIIVRTNREVEHLAGQLRQAGVAVAASADTDILEHPITLAVQALIEAVLHPERENALAHILHGTYWGVEAADRATILRHRSYGQPLSRILSNQDILHTIGVQDIAAVEHLWHTLEHARSFVPTMPPHRIVQYVLQESGFLTHVMQHEPVESGRVLRRLYDEIEALVMNDGQVTLEAIADMFTVRRQHTLPLQAPFIRTSPHAVQVMTAHKSKGLEFAVVFIPHLCDSMWGGTSRGQLFTIPLARIAHQEVFDSYDDERRLLYVAMTRARTNLHMTVSMTNQSGKTLTPSRLLSEIDETCVVQESVREIEQSFSVLDPLQQAKPELMIPVEFFQTALKDRGFSATSLNNYCANPWHYVYRNVLRMPEVQPLHMQFGTVVHNVLESVSAYHTKEGSVPSSTLLLTWIERELSRLPISVEEFTRLHEQATLVLTAYIPHLQSVLGVATEEEFSVRVMFPTGVPELPEIPLTGKLDRIDFDAHGQILRVTDYKTGKAKSRNDIEGKTAQSDGGYKRQLVFYALLLSLYGHERYQCRTMTISFVETAAKGKIKEETFVIESAEVEALAELIRQAVKDIVSGTFLADMELANNSEYAQLIPQLFFTKNPS